ncbi:hypothetical protein K470DRAFT_268514 [Piedraia hortae CBS 480.64]|uniref:Uncharacterized protein n=1 Tax=Piedraia hortae CBS 480.64 TaxID=1314780 RepID=A0A6A7C8I8_9PEZI|nr:hypothetical protein K470DRAFT_268514 [Piedraia hortae CBS 480.64]
MSWNALIKTHHITSRQKVQRLQKAAKELQVIVELRCGKNLSPGIMYVEGEEEGVRDWVEVVRRLRYKDFEMLRRPAPLRREEDGEVNKDVLPKGGAAEGGSSFGETGEMTEFARRMVRRRVFGWWKSAMGYGTS